MFYGTVPVAGIVGQFGSESSQLLLFRLRVLLDRCKCRRDARPRQFQTDSDLSLSVRAETLLEHRFATGQEFPRLGQLRGAVDGGEDVSPSRPGAIDHERELTTSIGG